MMKSIVELKQDRNLLILLIILGIILNDVCFVSNNNRMPIRTKEEINTDIYFNYTNKDDINYWYLADFSFNIKNKMIKFSAGNLMILISSMLLLVNIFKILLFKREEVKHET